MPIFNKIRHEREIFVFPNNPCFWHQLCPWLLSCYAYHINIWVNVSMSKLTRQIIEKTKVQLVEKDMKHTGRSIKKNVSHLHQHWMQHSGLIIKKIIMHNQKRTNFVPAKSQELRVIKAWNFKWIIDIWQKMCFTSFILSTVTSCSQRNGSNKSSCLYF